MRHKESQKVSGLNTENDRGIFTVLSPCLHYVPVLFYSLTMSHNADQVDVDLTYLFYPTAMVTSTTDILHLNTGVEIIVTFPSTTHLRRKSLNARKYSVTMQI